MAEIGDIVVYNNNKYLVIAYIKPQYEKDFALNAVSFDDYAKRIEKLTDYYCVLLDDYNQIFQLPSFYHMFVQKNNAVDKKKLKVQYTKLKLVGKLPDCALFEDLYKEQIKEDWKKSVFYQEQLMMQSCIKKVFDTDGFYLLINKDEKYLLAKAGNKFYTLTKVVSYTFYDIERNFLLYGLPNDAIIDDDGTKVIPMFDLRKHYPNLKLRRNVKKENLYFMGNVVGKIVDF